MELHKLPVTLGEHLVGLLQEAGGGAVPGSYSAVTLGLFWPLVVISLTPVNPAKSSPGSLCDCGIFSSFTYPTVQRGRIFEQLALAPTWCGARWFFGDVLCYQ